MHELTPTEERDRQNFFYRLYGPGPDVSKISLKSLGCGFHHISPKTAKELCGKWGLPRHGYYMPIVFDGYRCEISRTIIDVGDPNVPRYVPGQVWAIMTTLHREKE